MPSSSVVENPVIIYCNPQFFHCLEVIEEKHLIFYTFPSSFCPNIVFCLSYAIHAELDSIFLFDEVHKFITGKLGSLVAVQYPWFPISIDCVLKTCQAKGNIHRIGQPPGQDLPTIYIHDCHQVHHAFRHSQIGNVSTPDMIGMVNLQVPEQIGELMAAFPLSRQVWPRGHGHEACIAHQGTNLLDRRTFEHVLDVLGNPAVPKEGGS